jgi:hypothetical protein
MFGFLTGSKTSPLHTEAQTSRRKMGLQGKAEPGRYNFRYKARFVIKGYRQQEGIDYNETFASVVRTQTYLFLFALAAIKKAHIHMMDVKTAFLQGDIDEEVHIQASEGFEHLCTEGTAHT